MLYREIIAVCSQIHTKHKYTMWAELYLVIAKMNFRIPEIVGNFLTSWGCLILQDEGTADPKKRTTSQKTWDLINIVSRSDCSKLGKHRVAVSTNVMTVPGDWPHNSYGAPPASSRGLLLSSVTFTVPNKMWIRFQPRILQSRATKLCTVTPMSLGYQYRMFHVTILAPSTLRWHLDLWRFGDW